MIDPGIATEIAPYAKIRTDSYVMLAALLEQPPSEHLLVIVQTLEWEGPVPEVLGQALLALRQAGRDIPLASIEDEYDRLFVGLGCGELIPYASWYRQKRIQSTPLASLRDDLLSLGIVRQEDSHESEDHAGALCEIMALLARQPDKVPYAIQAQFFYRHLVPWMVTFFRDLTETKSARFYRAVGEFGCCFLQTENEYLKEGDQGEYPLQ